MLTYASYVNRGKSMFGSSLMIGGSDLGVALLAGFMIFPLVFSQGLESQVIGEGIGNSQALFLTVPVAFIQIGGFLGKFLMFAFFVMLTFAAASSSIAALEVMVSWLDDTFAWARYRSAIVATVYAMVLGLIAAVSSTALGWMDAFLSTVLLVAGGFGISLVFGFGIRDRVNLLLGDDGHPPASTLRLARVFSFILVFVVPVLLAVIFLLSLPCTLNSLFFLNVPTPTC
jgi:NSS family neurotransmitter:Na+ symporter